MGESCFGWAETNRGYRIVRLVWALVMISRKRNLDFVLQTVGVGEQGVNCLQLGLKRRHLGV